METIIDHIAQLKNMVSLKYIEPTLRDKTINTLRSYQQDEPHLAQLSSCLGYLFKMEQVHQKMMQQVSRFLQYLTPFITQCQNTIQSSQQQLVENVQLRSRQVSEQMEMQSEMKQTIQMMGRQLNLREQQTKYLMLRIEEKDTIIYNLQKQQSQYFKKMQTDFQKQHKALEQSINIITKLEDQNKQLQQQNQMYIQIQLNCNKSPIAIHQSPHNYHQYNNQNIVCSYQKSPEQLQHCSLISSRSEGLSQFEGIHADQNQIQQKQQFVVGQRQASPDLAKVQTLKQLLNVSVQKEYTLKYNTFESIQSRDQKQNYRANWLKDSKSNSKQKCEQEAVNNLIQPLQPTQQITKKSIKQFKLALHAANPTHPLKTANPYYIYFLIASQNVKIKSQKFEQFSSIQSTPCWQLLQQRAIPLHEWEIEIEKYLNKMIK